MITGLSPLGTVGFGGSSIDPVYDGAIRHVPVAVVVAVLVTSPETSTSFYLPAADIAVAAHNAEMNTGSLATPNAAPVIVETGRLGQGASVVAPTVVLSVTAGASVSSVVSAIPPADVSVGAASCAQRLRSLPSAIAVVSSGAAPTQRNATLLEATNVAVGAAAISNEPISTAAQVNIVITTQSVAHALTSALATSNVAVAGQASSTGLAQTPAKTTVGVTARNVAISSANVAGAAGVSVSGATPTQGIITSIVDVQIDVAGAAPTDRAIQSMPGVAVVVQTVSSDTCTLSAPTVVAVTATVGVPGMEAENKPPTALVWVHPNAIVTSSENAQGIVVVLNTNTLAVSEYSLKCVLDVVEHDGKVHFVTAENILVQRDGGGSAGTITTGDLDLGGVNSVALNIAHLDLQSDGALHLIATALQDGDEKSKRYLVPTRPGASDRNRRVRLGKGMLGNAWRFTLAPPSDKVCNWSLSGWTVETDRSKSRRR